MQLSYKDNKLEKLCTDEREMKRKRPDLVKKLPLRIKALEEAKTLGELADLDPFGKWHELTGDRAGVWSGTASANYRLLVQPEPNALTATEAVVLEITDYH